MPIRIAFSAAILFFCGTLVSRLAAASPHYATPTPASDAALLDIAFVDAHHGWAVGAAGTVLHTNDGGTQWTPQTSGTHATLRFVQFTDTQHGTVLGHYRSPYTGRTEAVVLHTHDGGQTWTRRDSLMPGVLTAEAFHDRSGAALVGPNLGQPEVFYGTEDGRDWQSVHLSPPAQPNQAWSIAALAGPQTGILASPGGWITRLVRGDQSPPTRLNLPAPLRAACLQRPGTAWLAGDDGLLLRSNDLGRSFEPVTTGLPTQDVTAVHTAGDHVWLVGSRGDAVGYSPDRGESWTRQTTGSTLPLRAACFLDEQTGWAVGDYGRIVATRDGGRTWLDQRNGKHHAAVLCIAERFDQLPLGAIAHLSLADGYRVAVHVMEEAYPQRVREALALLGAAASFGPPPRQDRALGTWRPAVVIVAGDLAEELLGGGRSVSLPPGGPKRVFAALPAGQRGTHRTPTDRPLDSTALTAADAAQEAWSLVAPKGRDEPAACEYRLAAQSPDAPAPNGNHPLAGLAGLAEARRPPGVDRGGLTAATRRLAERRRNLRGLARVAGDNTAWLPQLAGLSAELPPHLAAPMLFELSRHAQRQSRPIRAADTLLLLVKRYPDHPLAEAALMELVAYFGSAEAAHAAAPSDGAVVQSEPPAGLSGVQQASANQPIAALDPVVAGHLGRAVKIAEHVGKHRPALHPDPRFRLPAIAAQRTLGSDADEAFLARLARRAEHDPWRTPGHAEQWLRSAGKLVAPCPVVFCHRADDKPLLDGVLEEDAWQQGRPVSVADANGTKLRLAHDDEYFYFAVEAPHAATDSSASTEEPRTRDADLSRADRVVLRLDTDRDYLTAFRLAVDSAGRTHDRCLEDNGWDPEWFVAHHADAEHWRIEAAVPWRELTPTPPAAGDTWVLHAARHLLAETAPRGIPLWQTPTLLRFE